MAIDSLTEEQIAELITCQKQVERANTKLRQEGKHERRDFTARSQDGRHYFVIFTRHEHRHSGKLLGWSALEVEDRRRGHTGSMQRQRP